MTGLLLAITLVVRLYDNGTLTDEQRRLATQTANEILLAASVPTSWPDCVPSKPAPRRPAQQTAGAPSELTCSRPMQVGHVAIRLLRETRSSQTPGDVPLGYSLLDPSAGVGRFATIYVNRVEWVAAQGHVDPHVVLGRAIAHEIGHLLLGTARHADSGLMRALWSRAEIQANVASDWRFTDEQATAMMRALNGGPPAIQLAENSVRPDQVVR